MKNLVLLLVTSLTVTVASAQISKQVFTSPAIKEQIAKHKIVAILPFNVLITYRHPPKSFTAEGNAEEEIKMGKSIQRSMFTFLLRKQEAYTVQFQDVEKTNFLLEKIGLMNKLAETSKDEIAKALGVDAVLSGNYEIENTRSEAGAIITTVLWSGSTNKTGSLTLSLHNGNDGELIWRFAKEMQGTLFASTDMVIEHMMRKVSRNFPYTR